MGGHRDVMKGKWTVLAFLCGVLSSAIGTLLWSYPFTFERNRLKEG